jgi:hypothetical protein
MSVTRQLICALLGIVLAGCLELPGEPVAPSWDIQVSVALAKTSHSIRELVSDLASLPPEVLDTLDLTQVTVRYEGEVTFGDTSGDGVDDTGLSGEFFRSIKSGRIFIEAVNGTPVALELSMTIRDENGGGLMVLPGADSLLYLPPAPLDNTGKVGPATNAMSTLEVDEGFIPVLESGENLTYTIDINFPPEVGIDHVLTSDSLEIRTWGTFTTRVDPP